MIWRSLIRLAAPVALPLSVAELRSHLRLDSDTSQDDQIAAMIAAATDYLDGKDGILRRALVRQQWRIGFDGFPARCGRAWLRPDNALRLPLPPLLSVDALRYVDGDGTSQTLDPAAYQVVASEPAAIFPAYATSWPATRDHPDSVTIDFTAGYPGDSASPPDWTVNVPAGVKAAIKLLVGHWFENREAVAVGSQPSQEVALTVRALTDRLIA